MNRKTEHTVINFPEQEISLNQNSSYRQNVSKQSTRPALNNVVDISNIQQHIDDSDDDQSDSEYTVSDDEGSEYSDDDEIESIEYPSNNPAFTKVTNIPAVPYKNQNNMPPNNLPPNNLPQNIISQKNMPQNTVPHLQKQQPLSQHRKPINTNNNYQQSNQTYPQPSNQTYPQSQPNQIYPPQSNNMFNQPNMGHNVPFSSNTSLNQYNYQQNTQNENNHPQHNTTSSQLYLAQHEKQNNTQNYKSQNESRSFSKEDKKEKCCYGDECRIMCIGEDYL